MTEGYFIPASTGTAEYREKRSRFLGRIQCVQSEQEAKAALAAVRREHRDARHTCWCWRIHSGLEKYSDDGEPQGTAGLPMLTLLQRRGVENVLCTVTRYFGGILLGTGGLLRAYTQAAGQALDALRRCSRCGSFSFEFPMGPSPECGRLRRPAGRWKKRRNMRRKFFWIWRFRRCGRKSFCRG